MCLLIVVAGLHPELSLAVGANRDEWLERPADAMACHRDAAPRVLGGRDHRGGGTWLAVNDHGVVAALTNAPDPSGTGDPSRRTRGEIPVALASHPSARDAVDALAATVRPDDYSPAWLVVADRRERFVVDLTGDVATATPLGAGIHVVENRPPGSDTAKVRRVRSLLGDPRHLDADALATRLRATLADHHRSAEGAERSDHPPSGIAAATRAACVHAPGYGTRWSAVIGVPADASLAPRWTYRDGPACRGPDLDASPWWRGDVELSPRRTAGGPRPPNGRADRVRPRT